MRTGGAMLAEELKMAEVWGLRRQRVGRQTIDTGPPVVFPTPKLRPKLWIRLSRS